MWELGDNRIGCADHANDEQGSHVQRVFLEHQSQTDGGLVKDFAEQVQMCNH